MLNFLPGSPADLKPKITVVGVGGAGGNAVNNMISSKLEGVEFIVANTDAQAIAQSRTERRIQLGTAVTQGLGAGSRPDIGRAAAEESLEEIIAQIGGANMVFITGGMGGGTGSGAAPVIARAARDQGILTVGVVTKPFHFEGAHRMRTAEGAIEELSQYVDTLIIIPNQNLFRIATERTTFADAFKMADDVLYSGVRGVTDLMMMPGLINLDFADIRTVMSEMGKAMMGTGEAEGDKRAVEAAEAAISNPLLDDTSMKGAKGVLINITGGMDMTLFEVDEAANRIRDEVDPDANIIFGSTFDEKLNGKMRVSVVATGIASEAASQPRPTVISLAGATPAPSPAQMQAPAPAAVQPKPQAPQMQAAPRPAQPQPAFRPAQPQMAPAQPQQPMVSQPAAAQVQRAEPMIQQPRPAAAHGGLVGSAAVARQLPLEQPRMDLPQPQQPVIQDMAPPARMAPAMTAQRDDRLEPSMGDDDGFRADPDMHVESSGDYSGLDHSMSALSKAVTDIATHTHRPQAPAPDAEADQPRRPVSFFERLVSPRRSRAPAQREEPVAPQPQPQAQPQTQSAPQSAPRVGGATPRASEPQQSSRAVEDLDIPAFLRRQAN